MKIKKLYICTKLHPNEDLDNRGLVVEIDPEACFNHEEFYYWKAINPKPNESYGDKVSCSYISECFQPFKPTKKFKILFL